MSSPPTGDAPKATASAIPYATAAGGDFIIDAAGRRKPVYRLGTLVYTSGALAVLFFWLLFGDFAIAIRDRSVGPMVTELLKLYKASDTTVSLLLQALPPAIALFLSPIVSVKSDRYRSKMGRRIPFLLYSTPFAALGMIGIAFCPVMGRALAKVMGITEGVGVQIVFGVCWSFFEVAVIVAGAVFGGLINDVVPRQFLGRFFGLFRAVSLAAGMIFNYWLFKWATSHFMEIFIAVALIFGVGFTVMCLMVKEGEYPPPTINPDDPRTRGFVNNVNIYFRECFTHPYYLWVFGAMLFAGLTFVPFNLFSLPYSNALKLDKQFYGNLIAGSYFISLVLAYPLGWLVDKLHALRVGLVALCLYALSVLYGSLFVHDGLTFGVAMVAHTVLSGTYFTATASLGQALFPRSKFSQFASAAGQVGSLGNITMGIVVGPILDFSGSNYRLTFIMGLVLCVTAIALLLVVYRRFMDLGGPQGYTAPDDDALPPPAGSR